MQISGMGGGAAFGAAAGIGAPFAAGAAGLSANSLGAAGGAGDPSAVNPLATAAGGPADINSAQFLFAMLLLAALGKGKEGDNDKSDAALGFLAGMMMASAFQQFGSSGFTGAGGAAGGIATGGLLNVLA